MRASSLVWALVPAAAMASNAHAQAGFADPAASYDAQQAEAAATVKLRVDCPGSGGVDRNVAVGSGFVVTADGLTVTARHVVQAALLDPACSVQASSGPLAAPVRVPVIKPETAASADVALIQLPAARYAPLTLATAPDLDVEIEVRSVGFDLGLEKPQTHKGSVTSKSHNAPIVTVDTPFTHGSSGGPLSLAMCGTVVGIVDAGYERNGAAVPGQLRMVPISAAYDVYPAALARANRSVGPCQPWPTFVDNVYVVRRSEASRSIPYLRIPAGATILVDKDVSHIDWNAYFVEFGQDATIDLRAATTAPAKAAAGAPGTAPQPWGIQGENGRPGAPGVAGASAVDLSLSGVRVLGDGHLWILGDGGPGGDGGDGGNGGTGGGSSCGKLNASEPHTNGGRGGHGGDGGPGGAGGNAARVTLRHLAAAGICAPGCGPSALPKGWPAPILVVERPGCGGKAGRHGNGGAGGDSDRVGDRMRVCFPEVRFRDRVIVARDAVGAGPAGEDGTDLPGGPSGVCKPPEIQLSAVARPASTAPAP